jgi:hypothetical protein
MSSYNRIKSSLDIPSSDQPGPRPWTDSPVAELLADREEEKGDSYVVTVFL